MKLPGRDSADTLTIHFTFTLTIFMSGHNLITAVRSESHYSPSCNLQDVSSVWLHNDGVCWEGHTELIGRREEGSLVGENINDGDTVVSDDAIPALGYWRLPTQAEGARGENTSCHIPGDSTGYYAR